MTDAPEMPSEASRGRTLYEAIGMSVRFDLVPNMAHDGLQAVVPATAFFADRLARRRAEATSP